MPLRPSTLKVLPNPWAHVDHLGAPAGACPRDLVNDPSAGRWVGAKIDEELTVITRPEKKGELRNGQQRTVWCFSAQPVEVPHSAYYRRKVKRGELFAADEATAKACGVKHQDPKTLLAAAKETAAAAFDSAHGVGTFKQLDDEREARAKAEAEAKDARANKPQTKKGDTK